MSIISSQIRQQAQSNYQEKYGTLPTLSALQLHVLAFGEINKKGELVYSMTSIKKTVGQHGETSPNLVGFMVNAFNAIHTNQCPFGNNLFSKANQTEFKQALHLGTFRLYDEKGNFNKQAWQQVVNQQPSLSLTELMTKLKAFQKVSKPNKDNGRNAIGFFRSSTMQTMAADKAWQEVFSLLCHDWQPKADNKEKLEPVVDSELVELFFENSLLALEVASLLDLPKKQPEAIEVQQSEQASQSLC